MERLDLRKVNSVAPYFVELRDGTYQFVTDDGIHIAIEFEPERNFQFYGYWLGLLNLDRRPSQRDDNIKLTVCCIVEEFFRQNADFLLFICDTTNGKQAARNRLFLYWFSSFEHNEHYCIRNKRIVSEEQEDYISLIIPKSHPQFEDIVNYFDDVVQLFKDSKP